MTTRALTRVVAAAAVLLGLWLLVSVATRDGEPGTSAGPDDWTAFFGALTPGSVTSVRIEGEESLLLSREGDSWFIDSHPADSATVARFWSNLADTSVPTLVARNPDNHARMGLDADSALQLVFATDGDSLRLLVGEEGPSRATTYIRLPDSDAAYLARRGLRAYAERSLEDWRDRRVVAVDTSAVARVEVSPAGYALVRGDSAWSLVAGEEPEAAARPGLVTSLLSGLATLPAAGFLDEGAAAGLTDPDISVTAVSATGDTLATVELGELDSEWWATASGSETVYRIPSFRAEQLAPPLDAIRADP